MASQSSKTYAQRAESHANSLVRQLFNIAESKKTNVVVSADLTTSEELLSIADKLGPHIAVLKTHTDILTDLSSTTTSRLASLAKKHDFLIFEDRKFIDIGAVVQKQYRGGTTRIADWAHLVTVSVLAGQGIVDALAQSAADDEVKAMGNRGCLILAEMTTKGSLAVGEYTARSVEYARAHPEFVVGFVALSVLTERPEATRGRAAAGEDFVVFTTGVNMADKGDALGQQYNTPARAVAGGADFIISGRGIYAAADPVEAVQRYKREGWEAYLRRTGQ